MFRTLSPHARACVFCSIAMVLAVTVALAVPQSSDGAPLLTMFTPLLAVLLMMLVVTRDGWSGKGWAALGLGHPGLRAWPRALLIPLVTVTGCYLAADIAGALTVTPPRVTGLHPGAVAGALLVSLMLGLAEEIGWRGYLLPLLTTSGSWRAAALVGLVHGAWHLPLMFLTSTYNQHGNRWITVPVMLVVFTCAGIFYAWLRYGTASVWPVIIAHQAFNSASETADSMTSTEHPELMAYLVGETGLLTMLGVALIAVLIVRRADPPRRPPAHQRRPVARLARPTHG